MPEIPFNLDIKGLTDAQVLTARAEHGDNILEQKKENEFFKAIKGILKEPMVLLLLAASIIYLISGNTADALFLSVAIVVVAAISFFQDSRSRNALEKLKQISQPIAKVIRNGQLTQIRTDELVPGDSLMIEEGSFITADGNIIHSNDFSVNESVLTGESMAVYKDANTQNNHLYQGTIVASGLAIATVTATGNNTELGKIGKSLAAIKDEKTPLETQISKFVKKMVLTGVLFFVLIWLTNYLRSGQVLDSLLKALTLAMSILPEEIPVAFTTFMALGAWRLMQMGIVVKQMKTVETLGSASVICADKTGTLTQNKMTLAKVYVVDEDRIYEAHENGPGVNELIRDAMWASEPIPFDPMEIALHEAYINRAEQDERPVFKMIHEYPLGGKPPMMTHIFENSAGARIIAAKGAPEALMAVSSLSNDNKTKIIAALNNLARQGYRLLGVGSSEFEAPDFPEKQQDLTFTFKGLLAFYDPPKDHIKGVLQDFYHAGIDVKIITGDNPLTTNAIAQQIGFKGYDRSISGDELMQLNAHELSDVVNEKNIFTRMFPEAKLRIINALKARGEVVAMTGDGVNDGPALKAAHIGIAMGKKGTEIAKQAASMILMEDDLGKMVDAIRMGRKIYANLKKAIQYVISIHIPIILIVFIPLTLDWVFPAIFSPVHVIFLELIMGPTCSIIYENEPVEENSMKQAPRPLSSTFFKGSELLTSVIQGLAITAGLLFIYRYSVYENFNETITRTMVFATLISANIFLTLTNRSFYYSIIRTMRYPNKLVAYIVGITVLITFLLIYLPVLADFFEFQALSPSQLALSGGVGIFSVIWYEGVKLSKRLKSTSPNK